MSFCKVEVTAEAAVWAWDARPYPAFPAREDAWSDAENWTLGHWLNGRLGAVGLGDLVRDLCRRAGLPDARIDVAALDDVVSGFLVSAIESPRASIETLARHFGVDAVESAGVLRFRPRESGPVAVLSPDDLVAGPEGAEPFELTRAQETELPGALRWTLLRDDAAYESLAVEARRALAAPPRVAAEAHPIAAPPAEAERRVRRALAEAWTGRETAAFRLPPSRLALDPGDVVALVHDGRAVPYRIVQVADAEARAVEAVRVDPAAVPPAPGRAPRARAPRPTTHGPPELAVLDLPQLRDDHPAHRPLLAARARPWPGRLTVWRSPGADGFEPVAEIAAPARIGRLLGTLWPGPVDRFDPANEVFVEIDRGGLVSVSDAALFAGANALAVEGAPGAWEVLQFARAEPIAPDRWRLSRLLRGRRGTFDAMASPAPEGARVVILDEALVPLPVDLDALGLPIDWRVGPAGEPHAGPAFAALTVAATGRGLRPLPVAHVAQPFRAGREPGDLQLRWVRRSRHPAAESWAAAEVPLAEEAEAYEVEILDGAAVKRTLAAGAPSVVYAAAHQLADRGRLLGPGDELNVRIFQRSALVGRGAPRTVTLFL